MAATSEAGGGPDQQPVAVPECPGDSVLDEDQIGRGGATHLRVDSNPVHGISAQVGPGHGARSGTCIPARMVSRSARPGGIQAGRALDEDQALRTGEVKAPAWAAGDDLCS